ELESFSALAIQIRITLLVVNVCVVKRKNGVNQAPGAHYRARCAENMPGKRLAVKLLRTAKQEKDGEEAGNRSGDDKEEYRGASRVLELGRSNGGARFGEEDFQPVEDNRCQGEPVPGQNEWNRWFEVSKG